jgi:F-type H+-transporting ATPase subunit b
MMKMNVFAAAAPADGSAILLPAVYDLIWGGLSFLIVFVLFWKYVLPRMKTIMEERADRIEGGIERADKLQADAESTLTSYRASLADARQEAAAIRTQAQADAAAIIEQARAEALAQAAAITSAADVAIAADRAQAVSQLTSQVGALAVDLASRIVGEVLTDDARVQATVDAFVADLDAVGGR